MKTLKVLGCLLTYPSQEQVDALPEFIGILKKEKWLSEEALKELDHLMNWMAGQDLLDLQEEFVDLFDRTPSLCLHMFEHVHGDSRDRGQALVDLGGLYSELGLAICAGEIPDYLPMFLEYLSFLPSEEASHNLGGGVTVLDVLAGRLDNRQSLYVAVFRALIEASSRKPDKKAVEDALKEAAGKASTFDELDEAWEEQNAFENSLQTTGQNIANDAGGCCPKAEEMLARMNLPTTGSMTDAKKDKEKRS